jgi:hypothetical protein
MRDRTSGLQRGERALRRQRSRLLRRRDLHQPRVRSGMRPMRRYRLYALSRDETGGQL